MPTSTGGLIAVRISSAVMPLVTSGEVHGTVVSAHRVALNLLCVDRLVTCGLSELGALPNGIVVAGSDDLRGVAGGGDSVVVNVSAAHGWSPVLLPLPELPSTDAVERATRTAAARAPAVGFGPFLRSLDAEDDDLFRSSARPILRALLTATTNGDLRAAEVAAARLVGLGPGLTPSGDDVLVGFTAALTAARSGLAHPIACAAAAVGDRTTLVARNYLEHAARAEYAERVHELIGAVVSGDVAGVARGMSWGATSGADLLLGILLGARAAWRTDAARAA